MRDVEKILRKLFRPPSVANWVRHNFKRSDRTRNGLLRFAQVPPTYSLKDVYSICEAIVTDSISLEQAEKCAERIKDEKAREAARDIIPLFHAYVRETGFEGLSAFKGFSTPYPLGKGPDGKNITIPVTPTFIILQGAALVPVFVVGWASLTLNDYQKQLMSTIIKDALLTQEDFLGSDALVVCTPKLKRTNARHLVEWLVSTYGSLTEDELQDQFSRYRKALDDVARTLRSE
jgi:hypothetical protein